MHFLMEFIEGLRISWDAIRANKMRSILTGLGIVIGIVTVTLMGTAIEGLNRSFLNSISSIGADVLYAQRSSWMNRTWEDWMKSRNHPPITAAQVRAVQRLMTQSRAVAPHVETRRPIRYKDQRSDGVSIVGSTEALLLTLGLTVEQGRFLSVPEVEGGRPVCVIGAGVATNLFKLEPAVGARVRVDHFGFEVVGVLKKQGGMFGDAGVDNAVIIPVELFTSLFSLYPDYQIQVKAMDIAQLDETREELRGILRRARRLDPGEPDDFAIDQQEMFLDAFREVSTRIAAVGLFITGLSLCGRHRHHEHHVCVRCGTDPRDRGAQGDWCQTEGDPHAVPVRGGRDLPAGRRGWFGHRLSGDVGDEEIHGRSDVAQGRERGPPGLPGDRCVVRFLSGMACGTNEPGGCA
jgi:putative ABC transport system permease protein